MGRMHSQLLDPFRVAVFLHEVRGRCPRLLNPTASRLIADARATAPIPSCCFLLPAYCLLFSPAAGVETESHLGLNACWPVASPAGQCQSQFRPPAASRKTARECSLR